MTVRRNKLGTPPPWAAFVLVVGAMVLTGWSGRRFSPTPEHPRTRRWYRRLDKPGLTPPGPVFGGAWALIEGFLAFSGYRLLRRHSSPARDVGLVLWLLNSMSIAGWSALFFGRRALGPSAAAGGGMAALASSYAAVASKSDKVAAAAAIPLIGWLSFATFLAEEVWRRND